MVTIEISQTWLYLIFGAVLSVVIIPIILLLVWPWRRVKRRMESMEKESTDLRNQLDKDRQESFSWREELQKSLEKSLETIETIEKRVEIVAEKIGLKGDLLAWGRLMFSEGNLDEAITSFSELLDSEPSNNTARFYRGLCYLRKGRRYSKKAIEDLKIAVKADETNPDQHLALARAYLRAGNGKLSQEEATNALYWGVSDRLEAKVIIGSARLSKQDYDGAIDAFKECPLTHTPAATGWGQALINKARNSVDGEEKLRTYTEAIEVFDQAINLNPTPGDYYTFRAIAYAERNRPGDWDKAVENWKEAKTRVPRDTKPWETMGDAIYQRAISLPAGTHRDEGLKEALNNYTEALKRTTAEPYKPVLRNKRSVVYQLLGEFEKAFSETKAGVQENPNYAQNFMALATAAISAFAWKEAINAASSGIAIVEEEEGRAGTIWCLLFRIIGRCGDYQPLQNSLEDCKRLVDELENCQDFDPTRWEWPVAKERLEQAMRDWSADIAYLVRDSTALVEKDLSPFQYQAKYGI